MKFKILSLSIPLVCSLILSSCSPKIVEPSEPAETKEVENDDDYEYLQGRSEKRGVAFAWDDLQDIDILKDAVSWSYNWGPNISQDRQKKFATYDMRYYPMAWNNSYDKTKIASVINNDPKNNCLLAFNEPNLTDQANMTPQQAASYWPALRDFAKSNGYRIISPAMNNGTLPGWSDGVKWLETFFSQSGVSKDDVDGIALHIYQGGHSAALKELDKYKKFGKKIWLTEFCSWGGNESSEAQMSYMARMFNSLEQDDMVERYSWFIPRGGYATEKSPYMSLLTKSAGETTDRGELFLNLSTFDKNIAYSMNARIPAEHYRACSVDESKTSVDVALSSDEDGKLQIQSFSDGISVDYKVAFTKDAKGKFQIRYKAGRGGQLNLYEISELSSDERLIGLIELPSSKTWKTIEAEGLNFPTGEAIIRMKGVKGNMTINWIDFK